MLIQVGVITISRVHLHLVAAAGEVELEGELRVERGLLGEDERTFKVEFLLQLLELRRCAAHASRHLLILLKRCCWKFLFCMSVPMLSSFGATSMVFVEIMSTCCTSILSSTEASHLAVHLDGLLCLRIELYCMLSSWDSSSFTSILGGAMTRTSSANLRRGGSATAAVQRHAQRAAACEHCARTSTNEATVAETVGVVRVVVKVAGPVEATAAAVKVAEARAEARVEAVMEVAAMEVAAEAVATAVVERVVVRVAATAAAMALEDLGTEAAGTLGTEVREMEVEVAMVRGSSEEVMQEAAAREVVMVEEAKAAAKAVVASAADREVAAREAVVKVAAALGAEVAAVMAREVLMAREEAAMDSVVPGWVVAEARCLPKVQPEEATPGKAFA